MRNTTLILILTLIISACQKRIEKDFSTPESTMKTFVLAVENWELEVISECFEQDSPKYKNSLNKRKSEIQDLYLGQEIKFIKKADSFAVYKFTSKDIGGYIKLQKNGQWKLVSYKNPIERK